MPPESWGNSLISGSAGGSVRERSRVDCPIVWASGSGWRRARDGEYRGRWRSPRERSGCVHRRWAERSDGSRQAFAGVPSREVGRASREEAGAGQSKAGAKRRTRETRYAWPYYGSVDLPVNSFSTQHAFLEWLEENGGSSVGIWLRFAKKGSGVASVTYPEAVDAALCFGWIDGQVKGESEATYRQRYTPRGKRSIWSKINREKVAALVADGRMRPAGIAEVERAKADGRWAAAYDSPKTAAPPPELVAALATSPKAETAFAALSSQNRYSILFQLQTAKRAETRARRIAAFVAMLEG